MAQCGVVKVGFFQRKVTKPNFFYFIIFLQTD